MRASNWFWDIWDIMRLIIVLRTIGTDLGCDLWIYHKVERVI